MPHDLTKKEKSPLGEAIFNLFLWQYSSNTNFTTQLFSLISKADVENRARLELGFPYEMRAYQLWESAPNERKFFESWGLVK